MTQEAENTEFRLATSGNGLHRLEFRIPGYPEDSWHASPGALYSEEALRAIQQVINDHFDEHFVSKEAAQRVQGADWAQGPYALPGVTPDFKPKGDWIDELVDNMDGDGSIDRFTVSRSTVRDTILKALEIDRHERDLPSEEETEEPEPINYRYSLMLLSLKDGIARFGVQPPDGITARRGGIEYGVALVRQDIPAQLKIDERHWRTLGRPGEIEVTVR